MFSENKGKGLIHADLVTTSPEPITFTWQNQFFVWVIHVCILILILIPLQ